MIDEELTAWLRGCFQRAFPDVPEAAQAGRVVLSQRPEFGDFQCSDAMQLARPLRMAPRQIAQKAVEGASLPGVVAKVEIAGAGFINITLENAYIAERACNNGIPARGAGRTMIIGGLIQEKRNDDLQSVPFVNDIPFLRRLLGSTEAKIERSEILVLITGYIVNEKSQVEELIKRYNEALETLNDFDNTLGDKAKPRKGANKLDHSEFWR